ncbi:MAG: signal peptide peptidase SppA [Anaerolineae bacterium]|nr:signal peptide peptidase SppA [Anaerolineae bacterium]
MALKIPHRGRIAVVELFGSIGMALRSDEYVPMFEALRRSKAIKAVVLDIDSSGGEVSTSAYLRLAVSKLAAEKPVVAFVRGTCASGAYFVGCAAQKIVAMPYAVIGSIGVLSFWPVISELMERLGVQVEVSKSAELKDMHAFWRPPTTREREKAQALVDAFHEEFVSTVAEARGLEAEAVQALATGEVFWAREALQLGLVDELGDQERAFELAMELGQVPRRLIYVKPKRPRWRRWMGRFADSLLAEIGPHVERWLLPRLWF